MAIITISRGTVAGGEALAKALGDRLGYRTVSREEFYRQAEQAHGFKLDEFVELLEHAPSFRVENIGERRNRLSIGERRRSLFIAMQSTLCEAVKDDNVVYHGYAGHLLLPGISHILRVRLIAPRLQRIEFAMQREGLTRSEACRKIDQVDSERQRWTQAVFGVDWADPLLFDIVVNLENMSLEEAADLVGHAVALPRFQATAGSRKKLDDLTLASRVQTRLNADPALAGLGLDVVVDGGTVRLVGLHKGDVEGVVQVVREIEGVKEISVAERVV